MSLFRRRSEPVEENTGSVGEEPLGEGREADSVDVREAGATSRPSEFGGYDRSAGPWDASEVDEPAVVGPDEPPIIDLGAVRFRAQAGLELNLEVDEAQNRITSVTAKLKGSAVQLQAFAAPRSSGIWDEIRDGIAQSVSGQGGSVDEVPGVFGRELLARVPVRGADGKPTRQAVRFTGVDGPRWFLRAVFHGEAAYKPESAVALEELVRSVVVTRGTEAMAPRDLLPLRMPSVPGTEDADASAAQDGTDGAQGGREPLRPFERGPEITEVR